MFQHADSHWPEAMQAIDAAAWAAIRRARGTGTNLIVWENDRIVEITPDQAELQLRADENARVTQN